MATQKTSNELLFEAMVRHQIGLLRFSGYVTNRIITILNSSEQDVAEKIRSILQGQTGLRSTASFNRLDRVVTAVTKLRGAAMSQVSDELKAQMTDLAGHEAKNIDTTVKTTAVVVLDTVVPAASLLKAIALKRPFQGRILKDWASTIAAEDLTRIRAQIQIGMVAGETGPQIARRIVGTASLKGADGVTEITRRQAASITRTAVMHISGAVKSDYYAENDDLFDEEQFVATLDSRTTLVCMGNDGKTFPVGKGPQPPLHFGCRSIRIPSLGGASMADRPAKNVTNQQLVREFNDQEGLSASSRDDLPRGYKGKFDAFSRARIRELTGQVPGSTTYQTFLKGQSAQFQEDVLGKTKAKLFRNGDLSLDKFTNRQGDALTLADLAKSEAQAFVAAGLDPASFL